MKKKTVMVLFGGQSTEHEVSVMSAKNVIENIDKSIFDVVCVGITREGDWLLFDADTELMIPDKWQEYVRVAPANNEAPFKSPREFVESFARRMGFDGVDVVFPALHGINCEDGTLQGMLELCGIPYVGPGVLASSMGMDKEISKVIFEKAGIPQCRCEVVLREDLNDPEKMNALFERIENGILYPCFIKPANAGSSVGVHKAHNKDELISGIEDAASYDRKVLVEEFINGREIECAVLGNENPRASVLGEIIASNDFYDYAAKYLDNKSRCVIPADLTGESSDAIKEYAVKAYKALGCEGMTRVDFFVDKCNENIYINEVNTLPGFTSISMYPMLWGATGVGYTELITKLIDFAIDSFEAKKRKLVSL